MNKASDLTCGIKLHALFFQMADAQHLFEQMHGMYAVERRLFPSVF
jgi:phosphoheptose isomerase